MQKLSGKKKVDRINQLIREIKRLDKFIPLVDDFVYITLNPRRHMQAPFYEQDEDTKMHRGRMHALDVPDDIDIHSIIKRETMKVYEQKNKELNKLYGEF